MAPEWSEPFPQEVALTWTSELNKYNSFADDSVILLMYNKNKNFFSILESSTRTDANLSFTLPASYSGDVLEGWVFTGHRDGVKTSPSLHLGELTIS